jgi:hypothetical protein
MNELGNACYYSVQNLSSPTLREERRLRVFENRGLSRILGPKRDEVTGGWRKLHNQELHNFCPPPSTIRMIESWRMRWAGNVGRMGRRGIHIGYCLEGQKRDLTPPHETKKVLYRISLMAYNCI